VRGLAQGARGLAQDISPSYGEYEDFTVPVIGVVAAQGFSEKLIKKTLTEGLKQAPAETIWVTRQANRGGDLLVNQILSRSSPVVLDTNPYWNYSYDKEGKQRKVYGATHWRDYELASCCSKLIVFHKPGSRTQWFADQARLNPRITVIEEGK